MTTRWKRKPARMRSLAIAVATWFGAGYAPVAPGTAGALAGLAIAWLMHQYLGAGPLVFGLMGVIVFFPGVWAARAKRPSQWGRRTRA